MYVKRAASAWNERAFPSLDGIALYIQKVKIHAYCDYW